MSGTDRPPATGTTYDIRFDRIGHHRPPPAVFIATSEDHLTELIAHHADRYLPAAPLVALDSGHKGWISVGGRAAGEFVWRPRPEPGPTRAEAATWISRHALWTTPADPADPTVVRVAVGFAGAEIMAGDEYWPERKAQLLTYAALFDMTPEDVEASIDRAATALMTGTL